MNRQWMRPALCVCIVLGSGAWAGAAQTGQPPARDRAAEAKPRQEGLAIDETAASRAGEGGAITVGACVTGGGSTMATTRQQCRDAGGVWHATLLRQTPVRPPETETSGGAPKTVYPKGLR